MLSHETATEFDDGTPDWEKVTLDLPCPRCGYNLRMLTIARCPECGLAFRWREILEAVDAKTTTGGFFEFEWRRRPIGAFFYTAAQCLMPWSLWRRMPLAATPRVGALLAMIPLTLLLLLAVSALQDLAWHEYQKLYIGKFIGQTNFSGFPWYWSASQTVRNLATPLAVLTVVWFSAQVFRQTISRYRIRQDQILRIVVLTWIAIVVAKGASEWACTFATMPYNWFWHIVFPSTVWQAVNAMPTLLLVASLGFAFRNYLRIRDGWLWVGLILAMMVAFLLFMETILSLVYFDSFANPFWDAISEWFPPIRDVPMLVDQWLRWLHGYG